MAVNEISWIGMALADGRYRITDKLGEGGMGLVFRASDRNLQTDVVIKIPRVGNWQDRSFVKRFNEEIRSLVRLAHPHIVKVLDAGEFEGLPFAVMQFLSGGSLESARAVGPDGQPLPMPPDSVANWIGPIADALDFIHSQRYIHRDIKPANILFDAYGNVYLSDFGVAKALTALGPNDPHHAARSATGAMALPGTLRYMAPEAIMGQNADGRADQYSLALTIHELLTAKPPFEDMHPAAIIFHSVDSEIPSAHQVEPSVPLAVSQVIDRALAKSPDGRFATCAAFARALQEALKSPAGGSAPAALPGAALPGAALPGATLNKPALAASLAAGSSGSANPAPESHTLYCPNCRKKLKVGQQHRGRSIRCLTCQGVVKVPTDLGANPSVSGDGARLPGGPPSSEAATGMYVPLSPSNSMTGSASSAGFAAQPGQSGPTPPMLGEPKSGRVKGLDKLKASLPGGLGGGAVSSIRGADMRGADMRGADMRGAGPLAPVGSPTADLPARLAHSATDAAVTVTASGGLVPAFGTSGSLPTGSLPSSSLPTGSLPASSLSTGGLPDFSAARPKAQAGSRRSEAANLSGDLDAPTARSPLRWLLPTAVAVVLLAAAAGMVALLLRRGAEPSVDAPVTRDAVITGEIQIDFATRSRADADGNIPPDAVDTYTIDVRVRTRDDLEVQYTGTIIRRPPRKPASDKAGKDKPSSDKPSPDKPSSEKPSPDKPEKPSPDKPEKPSPDKPEKPGSDKPDKSERAQAAYMDFSINVFARQLDAMGQPIPGRTRPLGTITGKVPHTDDGRFLFSRLAWTGGLGSSESFRGEVQGRAGQKPETMPRTLTFGVNGQDLQVEIKSPDPMIFNGLRIPADGTLRLPATTLAGELTFNYESDCYLTDNLSFTSDEGTADVVQGVVVWRKDPKLYREKGISEYVFNLVFNPIRGQASTGAAKLFAEAQADLLKTNNEQSALSGLVTYIDTGEGEEEDGEYSIWPHKSVVSFRLNAHRLSERQIHSFLKMWLLMSGPINDE